jgi:hypothetical protein
MDISVFTPSHDSRYLGDCYRSLVSQSHSAWEWVVVLNRAAAAWRPPDRDDRVKVVRAPTHLAGVGALKRSPASWRRTMSCWSSTMTTSSPQIA